jgi:6-phosphogluconolactonase (cycloisomerase 2 family)
VPGGENNPGVVTVLTIDAETGAPVPIDDTVPGTVLVPFRPDFVTFDPSGARAYTNQTAPGLHFAVPLDVAHSDGDGTIYLPTTPTDDIPTSIEIGNTGRFGWVSTMDEAGGGALKLYDVYADGSLRNADTGLVTSARETYLGVSDPIALATDTAERWLYVLNSGSETLSVWEIDPTDGTLTFLDELPTGTDPVAMHLNESL